MLICKEEIFCDLLGPNYEYTTNTHFQIKEDFQ